MVPRAGTQSPGLHPRHCMTPMGYPWCPLEIFMGPLRVGKKGNRREEKGGDEEQRRGEERRGWRGREREGALGCFELRCWH